jgi:hypothetical protein
MQSQFAERSVSVWADGHRKQTQRVPKQSKRAVARLVHASSFPYRLHTASSEHKWVIMAGGGRDIGGYERVENVAEKPTVLSLSKSQWQVRPP